MKTKPGYYYVHKNDTGHPECKYIALPDGSHIMTYKNKFYPAPVNEPIPYKATGKVTKEEILR